MQRHENMIENIPEQLLYKQDKDEDVNIIIGENGGGKSTLLYELAEHFLDRGHEVVGIANTVHDKFDIRRKYFYSLKSSRGRRQTKEAIKNAIVNISDDNEQGLRNASRALEYVGFDPVIGFEVVSFHPNYEEIIDSFEDASKDIKEEIISLLKKLEYETSYRKIHWFEMGNYTFKDVNLISFTRLFPYESILKNLGIISGFEIFLSKQGKEIPLLRASSGELSVITSIVFLATVIKDRRTVILIDEPENSLHPKWQREYVKILLDIFYYYQPKIIVATHSPMVVNGTEMNVNKALIYKAENFNFYLQQSEPKNIEEMFYTFFEITTPENRFLSNLLVMHLNDLAGKKIDITTFKQRIGEIERSIYDERQTNLISKVYDIASDIQKN
jgi:predicted ATPase